MIHTHTGDQSIKSLARVTNVEGFLLACEVKNKARAKEIKYTATVCHDHETYVKVMWKYIYLSLLYH